jgi:hypothetical protein
LLHLLIIKIDPPACDELSRVEASHNPGPDRSPVRYSPNLGLQLRIGNINISKRVAPGRALGILGTFNFRHFYEQLIMACNLRMPQQHKKNVRKI